MWYVALCSCYIRTCEILILKICWVTDLGRVRNGPAGGSTVPLGRGLVGMTSRFFCPQD